MKISRRILIVEDERRKPMLLKKEMKAKGYAAFEAKNGK